MFKIILTLLILIKISFSQTIYTLDQFIDIAMENNVNIRIEQMRVSAALADKKGSLSVILPRISASTGSAFQGAYNQGVLGQVLNSTGLSFNESEYHSGSLSINQNIFDGGNWWNQIALSKNSYDLALESEQSVIVNSVLSVKRAFYEHLKNIELLEVFRRQVELSEQQVERVRQQFELEAVAKSDLLKQQVVLGDAKVQFLRQEAVLNNSSRSLANIVGIDIESSFDIEKPIVDKLVESEILDSQEYWDVIERNNPSLVAKRMLVASREIQLKIQRATYFPTLSMSVGYSGSSDKFEEVFSDIDKEWQRSINFSISYPLFTGFQRSTQFQRSKIQLDIEREELNQLTRNLKIQYENTFRLWKNINVSIPIFEDTKTSAEEDLKLARERYTLGAATILDLLNAQLSVAQANSSHVRAIYDERILKAELDALIGNR
ncbi:MAG: hypothetical protein CMG75_00190 [Candidatus Marinimicrobia bacterium]|nr:hypothetical protein [Candidatus Neomarinimicrobiota bacterium]|tara:strand:- start:26587 stop:27891 length:1305 start_codon:yes stop_codon:yes gene_type:complete